VMQGRGPQKAVNVRARGDDIVQGWNEVVAQKYLLNWVWRIR
jgi:hypothetical protein